MFLLNNQPMQLDVQFETSDGTQYPANWLRLASPDERAAIGIVETTDPDAFDVRFYYGPGVPKDLDDLKTEFAAQMNRQAYSLLSSSDWMVIRAAEGTPVPQEWTDYRAAVRASANTAQEEIKSVTSIDALIETINAVNWPNAPVAQ